jgi:2-keto-4-pentenoate hydratase/2-oxohepta-3-ene-1,7-dioic acid hydratase in catechol pathway
MRVGTVSTAAGPVLAIERDGSWRRWAPPADGGHSALDVLAQGERASADGELRPADLDPVRLLPPVLPPRNMICLGKNYRAHAQEFAAYANEAEAVPDAPIVFTKPVTALCGAYDDITVDPAVTSALDYEVELGVVIGTGGRGIPEADALAHVAGYTVVNDITARDLQQRHKQWFLGKSLPAATPVGPVVVSPGELTGFASRAIRCWVNDELRQDSSLGQMIFGVPETIAAVSRIVPLLPGDLIAMGTPSGVGLGYEPPRFLADGDRVVCEIEGIGRLDNTFRFSPVPRRTAEENAHA